MRMIYFLLWGLGIILAFGLAELVLLRTMNPPFWKKKWVRVSAIALPIVGAIMVVAFGAGEYYAISWLSIPAAALVGVIFVLEICLMLSLPLSGIVHLISHLFDKQSKKKERDETVVDRNRRLFLKTTAAALPIASLSMGASGFGRALFSANVYKRQIAIAGLPDDLIGLKILHLSDLHLRHYVDLNDVESVLEKAAEFSPDLIAITGDVADDLSQLPDTLKLIAQLNPRFGSFGVLGNHEYFRGIEAVHRMWDESPIPLLVGIGIGLTVGSSSLFVAGIDDPRRMGAKDRDFFVRTIDTAFDGSPSEKSFNLLLSHRPDALDRASEVGVDLTLAGHTHGGQVGWFGRSVFEPLWPDRYIWGHYRRENSHLYTSSGMGHWFPFRLGCPPEAPAIELVRPR
jgi:predicted MPP superfamily phosphohydrolase